MNSTIPLLLSMLLASSAASAAPRSEENSRAEFSVDAMTFNLDWDDQQFGWPQADCLELGVGDNIPSDCKTVRFNLGGEDKRNQPPETHQSPPTQTNSQ